MEKRIERLKILVPIRQFLEKEGIGIAKETISAQIETMKKDPNPFGRYPPKPLTHVMVRQCITWEDLRLMIMTDIGMSMWAKRQWRQQFPTPQSWSAHCSEKAAEFRDQFGKFTIIPFTINRWPKGAKDEDEAKAMLKKQAETARKQLMQGKTTDSSVKELEPEILPFSCFGADNTSHMEELAVGSVSRPLKSGSGWYLLKRLFLTGEDIADVLKNKYLSDTRDETEDRIRTETVIK